MRSLSARDSFWTVIPAPASDLRPAKLTCPSSHKGRQVEREWSTAHAAGSRSFELSQRLPWCRKEAAIQKQGDAGTLLRIRCNWVRPDCNITPSGCNTQAERTPFDHAECVASSTKKTSPFHSLPKNNPRQMSSSGVFFFRGCFQTDRNAEANQIKVSPPVVERTRGICWNQIAGRHLHSGGNCWKMSHRINRF